MEYLLAQNPAKLDFKAIEAEGLKGFKFSGASIGDVVSALVPYAFTLAGVILLFYIAAAGYSWMTSAGDPKAVQTAKGRFTGGIIGFLIVFSAYWIVQGVGYMLGLPQFRQIFGGP